MDKFRERFNKLPYSPTYCDYDENGLLKEWKEYRSVMLQNFVFFGEYGIESVFNNYGISEALNKSLDGFEKRKNELQKLSEKQFRYELNEMSKQKGSMIDDIERDIRYMVYRIDDKK